MEEPAVQQEKIEKSQERGEDRRKADWKNECSFSDLLKHSCFICWSSPGDTDVIEMDDRVLAKAAEIRVRPQHLPLELENALAVENMELQEQQSDCKDLEETMVKFEKHKEKLIQQIKATRQLCYEESQKILSLQAEEAQNESQVEEYERELARARWRLKKLREEVKRAKRKVEEARERDTPLQDSIRQSYEEILQEENTLCSISGGGVTPDSQLEESASPADTTEDDPLPMKPWGRSQSLPAYADLIMGAGDLSFCNNLAGTREDDESGSSSTKEMDRSDMEEDPENGKIHNKRNNEMEEASTLNPIPLNQLDFYQVNLFTYCQTDNDLFNEDLFPKTDSSDGFASDPFKGSDPFAKDIFFPSANNEVENEADTSLSCAENKASTGTQCFESEFPDEDSDIEISYSREDLDVIAVVDDSSGFKPIQSSSEEFMPEPTLERKCPGQHSIESDPSGYELDLCPVSSPSKIEFHHEFLAEEATTADTEGPQNPSCVSTQVVSHRRSDNLMFESKWISDLKQTDPQDLPPSEVTEGVENTTEEPRKVEYPHNPNAFQNQDVIKPDSHQTDLDLSYNSASPPCFDPYGFKLSPENSSHTLVDPDEAELSPEQAENIIFDDPSSPSPYEQNFDPYGFDISACQIVCDSDPYGFKLSPDEENQVVLDLCGNGDLVATYENNEELENFNYANQEVLNAQTYENREVLEESDYNFQKFIHYRSTGNQEVLEPPNSFNKELVTQEKRELVDTYSHENQEVVKTCPNINKDNLPEPCNYDNQEVLERDNGGNQELQGFSYPENQEVLDLDSHENQELLTFYDPENQAVLVSNCHHNKEPQNLTMIENQELLDLHSHDNQETPDMYSHEKVAKVKGNQDIVETELNLSFSNNSSDSDLESNNIQRVELGRTDVSSTNTANITTTDTLNKAISRMSAKHDSTISDSPNNQILFGSDLGSVFGAGGYIGCPDVADDLEPLKRSQDKPPKSAPDPVHSQRPVRPPRPSLKNKEKATSQGIDLK
ncbi:uncharacterized protein LOC129361789 isoform X1 [Poeciliopsis prolifica]|uniref:uncharacterized protein LOC129361789 isoform X1 n=1 Tax=Poeciliopsis prolifica TaxID=188132 RepID=UPI002413C01E|nr:uncharacterized protein LOC129361789 isoform X1 [Poeciliopsis prolifica]